MFLVKLQCFRSIEIILINESEIVILGKVGNCKWGVGNIEMPCEPHH